MPQVMAKGIRARESSPIKSQHHALYGLVANHVRCKPISFVSGRVRLDDVHVGLGRPYLQVRGEFAKLGRSRRVPLWWDRSTLEDLEAWKAFRESEGAAGDDPFVCSLQRATMGRRLNRHVLRRRFLTACWVLGRELWRTPTIHHGRHTFISHALAGGRTLAEVRAAAGYASLLTTSVYLHVAVDYDGEVGSLF